MPTSMGTRLGLTIAGAIFGGVLGFGIGSGLRSGAPPGQGSVTGAQAQAQVVAPADDSAEFSLPSLDVFRTDADSEPTTLAGIMDLPGDFAQTAALYQLALDLDEAAILELLDEAESLRPPSQGQAAASILYGRYVELDPEGAVDRLLQRGGLYRGNWLARVFQAWSRTDLDAALARARRMGVQDKVMVGMAILQARDDLSAGRRESIAEELGMAGILPQLEAQQQLSRLEDPQAAWSAALELPNGQERAMRLQALAGVWGSMDPEAAMAAVEDLQRLDQKLGLQQQVVVQWAGRDIDGALEWALAQPQSASRPALISAALTVLASSDPQRAMQLTSVLTGSEHQQAIAAVLSAWSRADPRAAAQSLLAVQDPATRQSAARQIASAYANSYPQEAVQWMKQLEPADADLAAVSIVRTLAHQDPLAASALVDDIVDPDQRRRAAGRLVRQWARNDPEAAVRWTAQVADPELRDQLYANVLPRWAAFDSSSALRYIDGIADVPRREAALTSVLPALQDPALMDRLYESLTLPANRQRAAQQLFQYWQNVEPARARAYAEAAGITPRRAAEMSGQMLLNSSGASMTRAIPIQ